MTETRTSLGISRVEGVAVGHAIVWRVDPCSRRLAGTKAEEEGRLQRTIASAKRGVEGLMRLLPRGEAELFEPELMILDELKATLGASLAAGERAEDVVERSMSEAGVELLMDARARILDALAHDYRSVEGHLDGSEGDVILVTETLTPSVVASLPPRVVGIMASISGGDPSEQSGASTAHSVILAREREIAVALVAAEELALVMEGDLVVVDTTDGSALVSVAASPEVARDASAKRQAWLRAREDEDASTTEPLGDLGVRVLVNIGSLHDRVPASADGVGLVRTELVFSDHENAPSEAEQLGVVYALAALSPGTRIIVRLFDAGGDKPLPWLPAPRGAMEARGIELLLHHAQVLGAQLRALVRAAAHVDLGILVPYVRHPDDVGRIREMTSGRVAVGALIETIEAVAQIDEIAAVSDFVSIGTNDLSASVTGIARANAGLALDARLGQMIERVSVACQARSRSVTVCGEMAGDPHGARVLTGLGVHALSVSPGRVSPVKRALRGVSVEDCRAIAQAAMKAH